MEGRKEGEEGLLFLNDLAPQETSREEGFHDRIAVLDAAVCEAEEGYALGVEFLCGLAFVGDCVLVELGLDGK